MSTKNEECNCDQALELKERIDDIQAKLDEAESIIYNTCPPYIYSDYIEKMYNE